MIRPALLNSVHFGWRAGKKARISILFGTFFAFAPFPDILLG
jgi:hypothetical protein